MTIMYVGNVIVAGIISVLSLFNQELSQKTVWGNAGELGQAMYVTGSQWLAIAIISLCGLFINEVAFSVVFLHQLIYKGTYLLVSVLPNILKKDYDSIPVEMSCFFLVWVILLPFAIPWDYYLVNIR